MYHVHNGTGPQKLNYLITINTLPNRVLCHLAYFNDQEVK